MSKAPTPKTDDGERIAKVLARAGVCSRRDAERYIEAGRVSVDGVVLTTPAVKVRAGQKIMVDGTAIGAPEPTRLWRYHKPAGQVTTARDPQGRPTVFENLPSNLPRVVAVGRLDINTEGLLLLTNDGELARRLELPATGWLRRYRVRAFGRITQPQLDGLRDGIEIDGVRYGPIEAVIDRAEGPNVWMTIGLREGKNREVKRVLAALGLAVNRLIRVSFGPFQLGDLGRGEVVQVPARVLRDQLGEVPSPAGARHPAKKPITKEPVTKTPAPKKPGSKKPGSKTLKAKEPTSKDLARGRGRAARSPRDAEKKSARRHADRRRQS